MTVEAATDREVFLAYLDKVLCPQLKPGDVVIVDNLSTHKMEEVRQKIEAAQAELLSSALFAGPEPHRKGVVETQTSHRVDQSTLRRSPHPSHRNSTSSDPQRKRTGLVQT